MAPFLRPFRPFSKPPSSHKPITGSPTLSATTNASLIENEIDGPPRIITRADLRESVAAYTKLLEASAVYRASLAVLATSTTAFAIALEECARVKGATDSSASLLLGSGLQFMIANSSQVLSATLLANFEAPLIAAFSEYVQVLDERHEKYELLLTERTTAIRQTEYDNMKAGRKKSRDLNSFRRALESLQEQVRAVEAVKRSYYNETYDMENATWGLIASKVAFLLRSTLELSDRLASKANEPAVEKLLAENPDPFDVYREENQETREYASVLAPLSMNTLSTFIPRKPEGSLKERDETPSIASGSTPRQQAVSVSEVLGFASINISPSPARRPSNALATNDLQESPLGVSPPRPDLREQLSPRLSQDETVEEEHEPRRLATPLSMANLSINASPSELTDFAELSRDIVNQETKHSESSGNPNGVDIAVLQDLSEETDGMVGHYGESSIDLRARNHGDEYESE